MIFYHQFAFVRYFRLSKYFHLKTIAVTEKFSIYKADSNASDDCSWKNSGASLQWNDLFKMSSIRESVNDTNVNTFMGGSSGVGKGQLPPSRALTLPSSCPSFLPMRSSALDVCLTYTPTTVADPGATGPCPQWPNHKCTYTSDFCR